MEAKDLALAQKVIPGFAKLHDTARERLGRSLTLAEKVLFSHIAKWPEGKLERGKSHLTLLPDRVAMQDATAQMALLQFNVTGRESASVPSSVHCDHLIRAEKGSRSDLLQAIDENEEVYEFLRSASAKFGIDFWKPGAGIIHQVVLEQYAFPGGMMIGTDSHTPNMGGLCMIAIGVGGADAVDVMAGQPWGLLNPKLVGVHLKGSLSGWAAPKDVILKVAELLTVKGGTGKIVEYFGEGTSSISCTGKGTITNMGAEIGATTSIFPYDSRMADYLKATKRTEVAKLADQHSACLRADDEVLADPSKFYDEVFEIDLSTLEPAWVGPHTPDLRHPVSSMRKALKEKGYPQDVRVALIGSCTNSSYEDISRAASIAEQARSKGLKTKIPLMVTPGSDQIHQTIIRDGHMKIFEDVGATVLANACGPCIGQWKRSDVPAGEPNTIVTSYNRNFRKRNDGNPETLAFIGSPEVVTAMAFSGDLGFDPSRDSISVDGGAQITFSEPKGDELPANGFEFSREGFIAPPDSAEERAKLQIQIDPKSDRLAFLESFDAWDGRDFTNLRVLVKAKGKCTTDHISQAGPWLKYRGHLDNISNNMFLGAINAYTDEAGKGMNVLTGETGISFPDVARAYKREGVGWIAVGDENYGEGSSREHAAMEPRHLGCKAVLAKSFARIAETNLKKQGVLPITFVNPSDYDLIGEKDSVDISGVTSLKPGSQLTVTLRGEAGERTFSVRHSLTEEQIGWFQAGSALNKIKAG